MKNFRLFISAAVLTVGLGLVNPVLPQSGCNPDPGQTSTPPCAATQLAMDEPNSSGQPETPPASNTFGLKSAVETLVALLLF